MSVPFRKIELPPLAGNWQEWILFYLNKTDAKVFNHKISLIQRKSGLPWLPKDMWNYIIRLVFVADIEHAHSIPETHIVDWYTNWQKDPIQKHCNPMVLANGTNNIKGEIDKDTLLISVRKAPIDSSGKLIHHCYDFVGLLLSDLAITHIKTCNVVFENGTKIPFDFTNKMYSFPLGRKKVYVTPIHPRLYFTIGESSFIQFEFKPPKLRWQRSIRIATFEYGLNVCMKFYNDRFYRSNK